MATESKGGKNAAQQVNPESDDVQAERITDVKADGVNVDLSLDEGTVYADPNELIIDASDPAVIGFDQGGVYAPKDTGIIATPSSAPRAKRAAGGDTAVFTNTRYPEMKVSLTTEGEDGHRRRTGRFLKFNSSKLITNAEDAKALEALKLPGVYREPSNFATEDPNSDKFFVHQATGFKTLSKEAYEDWVNNSEWSAVPANTNR